MASPELSARLRYLNESAHLLATTAPETSRYLMSRCNALIFDHQIEVDDKQKMASCGACGTLILPGWEGILESHCERSKGIKKGKRQNRAVQSRSLVYECGTCGKKTQERVEPPPPVKKNVVGASVSKAPKQLTVSTPAQSSSKKRAKARKGGLVAILAQKKTVDTSGGFDLMDFMKKV
jgi:RNase P subunit RPR2